MEKWADCGISHMRYDAERTHIVKVKVRKDQGETLGATEEWTRQ